MLSDKRENHHFIPWVESLIFLIQKEAKTIQEQAEQITQFKKPSKNCVMK
jgi:hypothetical protein